MDPRVKPRATGSFSCSGFGRFEPLLSVVAGLVPAAPSLRHSAKTIGVTGTKPDHGENSSV
jgi:hypothetical protein